MLKIVSATLAAAVLVAGLGMSPADAKHKKKKMMMKPKAEASTTCMNSASPLMRDEHKYSNCFMGMQSKK